MSTILDWAGCVGRQRDLYALISVQLVEMVFRAVDTLLIFTLTGSLHCRLMAFLSIPFNSSRKTKPVQEDSQRVDGNNQSFEGRHTPLDTTGTVLLSTRGNNSGPGLTWGWGKTGNQDLESGGRVWLLRQTGLTQTPGENVQGYWRGNTRPINVEEL